MTIRENLARWIWVVIPVVIMLAFEKMIFAAIQFVYGNHVNPGIFFYLPFLSLLPPLLLFLIWYRQQHKDPTCKLVFSEKGKAGRDILLGIGLSIFLLLIFIGSFALLRSLSVKLPDYSSMSLAHHLFFSTLGAVVPGIAEEIYFRGFLAHKLRGLHPIVLILVTALSFASWHILSPPYLLHTFLIGIILGITYYRTKRLLPVIVAHSLANMSAGILILNGWV